MDELSVSREGSSVSFRMEMEIADTLSRPQLEQQRIRVASPTAPSSVRSSLEAFSARPSLSRSPSPSTRLNPKRRLLGTVISQEGDFDHHEVILGYDENLLATLCVLFVRSGTILANARLWVEQAIVFGLFLVAYLTTPELPVKDSHAEALKYLVDLLTTLGTFLLSFYTSNMLARWWRLRTEGIGAMWSACSQLSLFLSQFVTRDERVLSAIRRYSRTSLMLIFMRHRGQLGNLDLLSQRNLLTHEEVSCLRAWGNNLSESIWTWHAAIVMMLYKQGLIKTEYSLWHLFDKVNHGRGGAALIGAQMGTPLPVHYVHIIGFMIKLHNLVLAYTYGYRASLGMGAIVFHVARVFFPVLLYNAVLLINAKLANPFAEHELAFPQVKFDRTMEGDAKSYSDAGLNLPPWMKNAQVSGL